MALFSLSDHLARFAAGEVLLESNLPLGDHALVLPLAEAERVRAGLVTPEVAKRRSRKGVVLVVGPGLFDAERNRLTPMDVCVGDLVSFGQYAGETFEVMDLECYVMTRPELKVRQPQGHYALTEHRVGEGTDRDRFVYHEANLTCDHCPKEAPSALVLEERQRIVAAANAALKEPAPETPTA